MKNNHGQVLVLFLLLLPVLLILTTFIMEIGFSYLEKRKMEHVIQDTISFGLDHLEEEEDLLKQNMTNLLKENISDLYDIRMVIGEQEIRLQVAKKGTSIFSFITGPDKIIKLTYRGKIVENKKQIEKE